VSIVFHFLRLKIKNIAGLRSCLLSFFLVAMIYSVESQTILTPAEYKRQQILWEAEKYLGMRYRSRVGKHVFDCSGYVRYLMTKIDKNVTRSSVSQIHDGKRVADVKEARPGDILVFKGRNAKNNRPGHVGLVHHWSNDTLYFIHSSVAKGIVIDHMHDPYYKKRFLQVRNVMGD
jgi:cell wall-associated NlpC family hydrolase